MCIPQLSPPFQWARNTSNKGINLMTGHLPEEADNHDYRSISKEAVKGRVFDTLLKNIVQWCEMVMANCLFFLSLQHHPFRI